MTSKTETRPMTAHEIRSILTDAGATDAVVELALRLTAPGRHAARVEEAMRAALEYAARCTGSEAEPGAVEAMLRAVQDGKSGADLPRPNDLLSGECWALAAATHCATEAWVGRGGPCGAGGPGRGTERAPWAQKLGKGRAQASDGSAWDAALDEASKTLARAAGAPGGIVVLEPTGEGLRACMPGASVLLDFTVERAYALCVRGLASALPAEAPHRLKPLDAGYGFRWCNLRFEGALDEWARTLDRVGLAAAVGCLPDKVSEVDHLWDYIPHVFKPWAERAVAAREERRNQ